METNKTLPDLPLFELFNHLRQAGLPLGVDEYQLLIHALQGGFGVQDRVTLARLCKTIWIKSLEEERLFDYHFDRIVSQPIAIDRTPDTITQQINRPSTNIVKEPLYKRLWYKTKHIFRARSSVKKTPDTVLADLKTFEPPPQPLLKMEDEVQVAKAVLQPGRDVEASTYNFFSLADEYFPITRRQMKQCWRYLRYPVREGPSTELDIDATISGIGRDGMLLAPVLVPRRKNRAELLLLIDQGGSMIPFHALSRRLVGTAIRGGRLGQTNTYYFHNCPGEYLYRDSVHRDAKKMKDVLSGLHYRHTGVLIFSDAGAARGGYSPERIRLTEEFLHSLRSHVRYIAWLNPIPHERWEDTTAGLLMQSVPMFDISRRGLDDAISMLRGRPTPNIHIEARK